MSLGNKALGLVYGRFLHTGYYWALEAVYGILVQFFPFFVIPPGISHGVEGLVILITWNDAELFGFLVFLLSYMHHRR